MQLKAQEKGCKWSLSYDFFFCQTPEMLHINDSRRESIDTLKTQFSQHEVGHVNTTEADNYQPTHIAGHQIPLV